ncbi:hypothetical protein [Georgenia sp. AZ-5]|uniref:hypothetical protein n=1 Tax=Georgenia sp. AZ-5 TaxID=3367526 RepID=UPI003754CA83
MRTSPATSSTTPTSPPRSTHPSPSAPSPSAWATPAPAHQAASTARAETGEGQLPPVGAVEDPSAGLRGTAWSPLDDILDEATPAPLAGAGTASNALDPILTAGQPAPAAQDSGTGDPADDTEASGKAASTAALVSSEQTGSAGTAGPVGADAVTAGTATTSPSVGTAPAAETRLAAGSGVALGNDTRVFGAAGTVAGQPHAGADVAETAAPITSAAPGGPAEEHRPTTCVLTAGSGVSGPSATSAFGGTSDPATPLNGAGALGVALGAPLLAAVGGLLHRRQLAA